MYVSLSFHCPAARKATYDKFGEEGLKAGVPTGDGGEQLLIASNCRSPLIHVLATSGFVEGYTFHGDPHKVFQAFFGCGNPFAGMHNIQHMYRTNSTCTYMYVSHTCTCTLIPRNETVYNNV